MLTQHSAALHQHVSSGGGDGGSAAAAALAAHSHNPLEPPPLAQGARPAATMVDRAAPLRLLLQHVCEDVRALCVEKNSAAPDVEVVGGEGLEVPLVVPYFDFMAAEVLKNSLQVGGMEGGGTRPDRARHAVCAFPPRNQPSLMRSRRVWRLTQPRAGGRHALRRVAGG
jgi:hypothetical protein